MTRPYRPMIEDAIDAFFDNFCGCCARCDFDGFCPILTASFYIDADDPNFPAEWVEDETPPHNPRCTAFVPLSEGATAAEGEPEPAIAPEAFPPILAPPLRRRRLSRRR